MALLVIAGGLFGSIKTNQILTLNFNATATAQTQATTTAKNNLAATATMTALNATYVQATQGKVVFDDPLADNSKREQDRRSFLLPQDIDYFYLQFASNACPQWKGPT